MTFSDTGQNEAVSHRQEPIKTFIYGSCVSRDMFELAEPGEFEIARYVARQSLISSTRNASKEWPGNFKLESPFRDRIVRGDWVGNAEASIRYLKNTQGIDLLVLDLVDERFGVYEVDEGIYVTHSIDLAASDLNQQVKGKRFIPFGSDEHFEMWQKRARQFFYSLRKMGLLDKTVLFKVPWATHTDTGEAGELDSAGLSPAQANEAFERYYRVFEESQVKVIDLSDFPVVAEPLHQWGLGPFHYTLDVYQEMLTQVRNFVKEG